MDSKIERYFELFKAWKEIGRQRHIMFTTVMGKHDDLNNMRVRILNDSIDIGDIEKYYALALNIKQDIRTWYFLEDKLSEVAEIMREVEKQIIPLHVPDDAYLARYDKQCSLI